MRVFNSNNPDGAAIQRDDEEFFAKSGRQYRVRHPHQSEIDLFTQQGGKMRSPWPAAIIKRLSATNHQVIVFSMTDEIHDPSRGDPVHALQYASDTIFDLDQDACAATAASPIGTWHNNSLESETISHDDEAFFAATGRRYRFREAHPAELETHRRYGLLGHRWPLVIVKRLAAGEHQVCIVGVRNQPSASDLAQFSDEFGDQLFEEYERHNVMPGGLVGPKGDA